MRLQPKSGRRRKGIRLPALSCAVGRLPELDLVAFGIHDPAEFAVIGVVRLVEDVAAFLSQRLEERREVGDTVVDHECRLARRVVVVLRVADVPDGRAFERIAGVVRPLECRAAPGLDIDAEVLLVPGAERRGILRLEEDSADPGDAFHSGLRGLSARAVASAIGSPNRNMCERRSGPAESSLNETGYGNAETGSTTSRIARNTSTP